MRGNGESFVPDTDSDRLRRSVGTQLPGIKPIGGAPVLLPRIDPVECDGRSFCLVSYSKLRTWVPALSGRQSWILDARFVVQAP